MERPNYEAGSLTKNVQSRREQLRAWESSETNKAPSKMKSQQKVKFRFEVAFLAACSSSDFDEITRLLKEENVDINTSNVDGLTALHQACIDNKLELVRFLCEHGADLHARDKEGWTPLHATALGGHTEIAKYLIKRGASLTAANSDGDLPRDVAERSEMRNLLCAGLTEVEAAEARNAEATAMLNDANAWQREGRYRDLRDPVANAGPLHVAAAKGYQLALAALLQCPGAPLEAVDNDGWTALHAAAHWGQLEACELLVKHGANMDALTNANQTVFDLADDSVKLLLHELKNQQREMMREKITRRPNAVISTLKVEEGRGPAARRSSVTRLPQSERHDLTQKGAEQEKHPEKLLLGGSGGGGGAKAEAGLPPPGPPAAVSKAATAASAGRSPLASSESLSSEDELRQSSLAAAAAATGSKPTLQQQQQQQQRRPTPSPPSFIVTSAAASESPPPPAGASVALGKRRVEIIPAATTTADSSPAAAEPTTAGRSKVRSILTRMESLQETSSSGAGGASAVASRQNPLSSGARSGASGAGRVKSALPTLSSTTSTGGSLSASLDSPLVFPKSEPPAQSVSGSSSSSRLSQQDSSLSPAERLDRLLGSSSSRSSTSASAAAPSAASTTATGDLNGRSSLSPQRQPAAAASHRRVSVIMEKEKTGESETERRRISRHNRATKRLTQGVTPDDVEQARKLMASKAGGTGGSSAADSVDHNPTLAAVAEAASAPTVSAASSSASATTANVVASSSGVSSESGNGGSASAGSLLGSRLAEGNSTPDRLFRIRPGSYHGGVGGSGGSLTSATTTSTAAAASVTTVFSAAAAAAATTTAAPAQADYRLLYDTERIRTEQLDRENARMKRELERLRHQLESLQLQQQQQQQRSSIDRSLAGYEAQEKAAQAEAELTKLRQENNKLKADNTSLIRVISRLSSQPAAS